MKTGAGKETPENCYLGHKVSYDTIVEEFPKFVKEDGLISAFSGRIYWDTQTGKSPDGAGVRLLDFLLITKNHVVLWGRGLYGQTVEIIPYREISRVTFTKSIIFGEITIITKKGIQTRFGDIYHKDGPIARSEIEKHLTDDQEKHQEPTSRNHIMPDYRAFPEYSSPSQFHPFNRTTHSRNHG